MGIIIRVTLPRDHQSQVINQESLLRVIYQESSIESHPISESSIESHQPKIIKSRIIYQESSNQDHLSTIESHLKPGLLNQQCHIGNYHESHFNEDHWS